MVQKNHGSVALTGGTGFIGQHLIGALLREGWRVRALARRPGILPKDDRLVEVPGALEDRSALLDLVSGVDVVIHAGGRITARKRHDFESANIIGTENLVRAAADQPVPPRFIYLSTMAAREPHLSAYAATKREGEMRLRDVGHNLDWVILRPPVVYGPGDKQTLKLFRQFNKGVALELGSGGRFSMIYVDDLISAILYLLKDSDRKSATFELDDGHEGGYAWNDVVDEASRKLNRRIRSFAVPRALQHAIADLAGALSAISGTPPVLSRDKIKEFAHLDWVSTTNSLNNVTEWKPNVNLREGISRTLDWYVAQGWL